MQNRLDIYVNKDNKQYFDQVKAIADMNEISFSSLLGEAARDYIEKINNKPRLVATEKEWDIILNNLEPEEVAKYNTLIFKLNNKITKRLCHT